jgi:hypothetical protein
VLVSRFTTEDHHIDQPRGDCASTAVEIFGALDRTFRDVHTKIGNRAVRDQESAKGIQARARVNQPRIHQRQLLVLAGRGALSFGFGIHGGH